MNFFLMLVRLIPAILELIKQIEVLMPDAQGPMKLNLVLDTVNAAAASSPQAVGIDGKDLSGAVTKIVNTAVKTFNATGTFPAKQPTT